VASIFKKGGRKGKGGYIVEYTERPGLRRRVYAGNDLEAAKALGRKLETDALLRRKGIVDPLAERLAAEEAKPLGEHVKDFVATLLASGATAKHVGHTEAHVRRVLDATGAQRLSDLTASGVQRAIGAMIAEKGLSHRTANAHLASIKHFSAWLWRNGRTRTHALAGVKGYNVEEDRRLVRRALSDAELSALLHVAHEGGPVLGMAGPDRAVLYALAVGTGFRAGELASLTPQSFALDSDPPTVTVEAGYSKHRRRDVQPLPRGLAEVLWPWLIGKAAGVPVFGNLHRAAEMVKTDLEAAGVPAKTPEGVADFHSLRHSYISRLVRSGINVKLCQELARHSTPVLTLGRYAHVDMADKATALTMVPALAAPSDGARVPERVASEAAHECYSLASGGTDSHDDRGEGDFAESAGDVPGRARIGDLAEREGFEPSEEVYPLQRISNPLL